METRVATNIRLLFGIRPIRPIFFSTRPNTEYQTEKEMRKQTVICHVTFINAEDAL